MSARAEHYREKAEETRVIAEMMQHPETKEFLMSVASDYVMLAGVLDHMADPIPASE
ncbi:MAG: hypothetical protein JO056_01425 [Alphaproteobacteria bacterium]|nr:hypothetical protein [Alphaproteobacteria bacterium]